MPSLSSLIVQRQVASIAEVEQAIARQVIHGGDLVTNLLEIAPQCEHPLTRVLAESLGIPSVPPGRLPAPDNEVLDIVPVETALRYGVFPLRLSAKTLVIATSERLKPTALHDLAYALGLDLSQVASPLIRIREGIAAHYGVPLEPRQLRLVQRLDGMIEGQGMAPTRPLSPPGFLPSNLGSGVTSPPGPVEASVPTTRRKGTTLEMEEVKGPSLPPHDAPIDVHDLDDEEPEPLLEPRSAPRKSAPGVAFEEQDEEAAVAPDEEVRGFVSEPPPEVAPAASAETVVPGAVADLDGPRTQPEPEIPASPEPAPQEPPPEEPAPQEPPPEEPAPQEPPAEEPEPPPIDEAAPLPDVSPTPEEDSPRPPGMVDRRAVANLLRREIGSKRRGAGKTARKKGPFSRTEAERELEGARTAEEVIDTFFAFGSQFFAYSALFVVHGDLVEGRDAWGPGADRQRVLGLGVPLDLPSSLATVRKEGHVLLSRFDEHDLDRELVRDLERGGVSRQPLSAIVPLTVKRRAVAMLYGDDGDGDITIASLGELLGFSALASAQLERVAIAKKAKGGPFAGLVAPRAQPSSVEALARALSLPMPPSSAPVGIATRGEGSVADEPHGGSDRPRVSPGATSVQPPPPSAVEDEDEEEEAEVTLPRWSRDERPREERPEDGVLPSSVHANKTKVPPALIPSDGLASAALSSLQEELALGLAGAPMSRAREPKPSPEASWRSSHESFVEEEPEHPGPRERFAHAATVPLGIVPKSEAPRYEPRLVEEPAKPGTSRPPAAEARFDGPPVLAPDPEAYGIREAPEAPSRNHPFVPPIPRVDDDDASMLVAENVDAGESPRPSLRYEAEPLSDGRAGSYHLVPRPAEARLRGESADLAALLDRATSGGLEGEEAMSELLRRAEQDFPRLVERFPGPLVVDRLRARADLPPASECGPLLKLLVTMRRGALPFMTVKSTSQDVEQRFWATHVLGELLLPEASNAILPRLFDDEVSVRRVARRAAQALATAGAPGEPLKHSLDHTMRNQDEPISRRLLAIEALSDMRVPTVVPILIPGLRDESDSIVEATRTALMVVTRQDLGRNPNVWSAWWDIHQHEHRVEWLIQALTHETPSIRRTAGDELKSITREYFGYYDDLPPKERERAQARYFQWWREEGQYRFR